MPGTTIQICDIVEYTERPEDGPKRWRVDFYKKRVEETLPHREPPSIDSWERIIYDIHVMEWMKESYSRQEKGLPHSRRYCFKYCRPEEATHLQLYGLTYPIAPVEECRFIEVVPWSPELIAQHKEAALSEFRLNHCNNNFCPDWYWE